MQAETAIRIDKPRQHFDRLCAHLRNQHRLAVEIDGDRAEIILPDGWCALEIRAQGLYLFLKVWDHTELESTKAFFNRHLQRLVLQARLPISWVHPWTEGVASGDIPAAKLQGLAATLDQAAQGAQRG